MPDRRQNAATAGVGYGLVGAGGAIRGHAVDEAHEALGLEKRQKPAVLAVLKAKRAGVRGSGRLVRRTAGGSALATLGAPAAALGTYRLLHQRKVSKSASLVAQGVQGTGEAWKEKGKSLKSGAPLHVRLEAVGVGAAGALGGSLIAHRGLDVAGKLVKVRPGARSAITAAAAVPGTLATLPAAKKVMHRSGYAPTPTGTRKISKMDSLVYGREYRLFRELGHSHKMAHEFATHNANAKANQALRSAKERQVKRAVIGGSALAGVGAGVATKRKISKTLQELPLGNLPRYAIHRTRGRVAIAKYHGDGKFTVRDRQDHEILAHRKDLTFIRDRKLSKADGYRKNDYLGRHVSPAQQRSRVMAAGATPGPPGVGPLVAAHQAGRYAPPGRERSAEARQLAAPLIGAAAGVLGARHLGRLAEESPRVERGVRRTLRAAHKGAEKIPHAGLSSVAQKAVPKESTMTPKRTGQVAGFLAAKAVVGGAAGQVATSRNIAAENRYNRHHPISKLSTNPAMTDKQKGQLVRRKKASAVLGTASAAGGLSALAMLKSKAPEMAEHRNRLLAVTAGIGGVAQLNSASVARREAKAEKATIAKGTPPIKTTMDDKTAHNLVHGKGGYGLTGPLPHSLDRPDRMNAYQARYIASGGKKSQRWQHVANAGTNVANAGLAGATAAGLAVIGSRSPGLRRLAKPALHRLKHFEGLNSDSIKHKAEHAAVVSATAGGVGQLTAQGAKRRRAKYTSAPGGVAASNFRRMSAYSPGG